MTQAVEINPKQNMPLAVSPNPEKNSHSEGKRKEERAKKKKKGKEVGEERKMRERKEK